MKTKKLLGQHMIESMKNYKLWETNHNDGLRMFKHYLISIPYLKR